MKILRVEYFAIGLALALGGCSGGADVPEGKAPFKLVSFSPAVLVPGTKLVITGEGFRANEPMKITFDGSLTRDGAPAGRLVDTLSPKIESGTQLVAEVTRELIEKTGGGGDFEGKLGLEVVRDGTTYVAAFSVILGFAPELEPVLTRVKPSAVYFGDEVAIEGDGFLLGGGEGAFEVVATGEFSADDNTREELDAVVLKTTVPAREKALYLHTAELFGLRTGEFRGTLKAVNRHKGGAARESKPLDVSLIVLPSTIASLSPTKVSREQKVHLAGKGFFTDRSRGLVTEVRFRGRFKPHDDTVHDFRVDFTVKVESSDKATLVLQPKVEDENLVGFGAVPGVFTGDVMPILTAATEELEGQAWNGSFEVLPTKQVVHLKFTPGFTDALRLYGLRNLERQVKDRLLEVVRRDYADYSVEFREERPADWEKWSTVEITGDDPNASDLFGLDNSSGKDNGNLRLNDYVGGSNAEQVEAGSFAFGGVFVSSFMRFSPNICRKSDENGVPKYLKCNGASTHPMATKRFDDFFAPFAPLLGGSEAQLSEWESGPRKDRVRAAVKALGSIIGNTTTHEFGHSLGLAQDIGTDEFHNAGDATGYIMNPGGARPFAERAETNDPHTGLDDIMPAATWAPGDAEYLRKILPRR